MSEYTYRFIPKTQAQRDAMQSQAFALLHDGPWGSGKTYVGAAKALFLGVKYDNNVIALVRKKRVDLKPTLWAKFVDECLSCMPASAIVAKNDTDLYRKLANGTEFFGLGLDSEGDVNKLASREYGFIIVEEATELTEDDFDKKLIRCLRLPSVPFHQLMLICNPGSPASYLYKRFIEQPWPDYERIQAEMLKDLPPKYYEQINRLGGLLYQRYVLGEWVAREGTVYPFDPRKHVIKRFPIPADWRRVNAIDFGFALDHAFVFHSWVVSPGDVWYLDKEIFMTNRIVSRHAVDIKKICADRNTYPRAFCDHDAEDRATLESCGIATRPADKRRLAGQQTVYQLFEEDRIFFFEDSLYETDQRLMMADKPYRTTMEFPYYTWANKQKEDMIKEFDNGLDTLRYAMQTAKASGDFEAMVAAIVTGEARDYGGQRDSVSQAYAESKAEIKKLKRSRRKAASATRGR